MFSSNLILNPNLKHPTPNLKLNHPDTPLYCPRGISQGQSTLRTVSVAVSDVVINYHQQPNCHHRHHCSSTSNSCGTIFAIATSCHPPPPRPPPLTLPSAAAAVLVAGISKPNPLLQWSPNPAQIVASSGSQAAHAFTTVAAVLCPQWLVHVAYLQGLWKLGFTTYSWGNRNLKKRRLR